MPRLRSILASFCPLLFATAIAHAQGTVVTSVQVQPSQGQSSASGNGVSTMGGVVASIISSTGANVTGAPFSADVVDENDQFLADGNRIHHEMHGKTFRDSQGRTRQENELGYTSSGAPAFIHITIMDPVQKVFINLDPQNKTATVHSFSVMNGPIAVANQRPAATSAARPSGSPVAINASPTSTDTARATLTPQVQQKMAAVPAPKQEDLGTMEIEGFTVTGKRTTHTAPAGTIGNDKPITSTTERWTSVDLKTDLLVKTHGPQGDNVRKLINIQTVDPDPPLFQVPADYTVKETPQR